MSDLIIIRGVLFELSEHVFPTSPKIKEPQLSATVITFKLIPQSKVFEDNEACLNSQHYQICLLALNILPFRIIFRSQVTNLSIKVIPIGTLNVD
mmetsp:Transcript_16584/g.20275  ORF Transcript_16584/g.20275 Transcript_16584/m.20275 type:complete len:95 (+) Transcript_16584:177-461(+)